MPTIHATSAAKPTQRTAGTAARTLSGSDAKKYAKILLDYPKRGYARNYLAALSQLNQLSGGTEATALLKAYKQAPSEPLDSFHSEDFMDDRLPPRATNLLAKRQLDTEFYPGGSDLVQNAMQEWVWSAKSGTEKTARIAEAKGLYQTINSEYQWAGLSKTRPVKRREIDSW